MVVSSMMNKDNQLPWKQLEENEVYPLTWHSVNNALLIAFITKIKLAKEAKLDLQIAKTYFNQVL